MKKNQKGFTLVELLAVIVILAVIILIAVNAIIPQMNKARKNAFIDEVAVYAQAAEKAYVANQIDEGTTPTCYPVTGSGTNVLNGNYVKKADDAYKGKVVLDADGNLSAIYLTNGKYMIVKASGATAKPASSDVVNHIASGTGAWASSYESCS